VTGKDIECATRDNATTKLTEFVIWPNQHPSLQQSAKRESPLRFRIFGNVMLSIPAFITSWKFGLAWLGFAILVFIAAEKQFTAEGRYGCAEVTVTIIV
jgi:hypothetical protein